MKQKIGIFCLLYPFVFSAMNLQGFVSWYISSQLGQIMAYLNLGVLIVGASIFIKTRAAYSTTARNWIFFYLVYYAFGLISSVKYDRFSYLFQSLIPPIYFFSFYVFLREKRNRFIFLKVLLYTFVLSSFFLVLFYLIGYDVDTLGTPKWGIDRAEGLFGDANNSCLIAILTYVLVHFHFNPGKKFKLIKTVLLLFIFYSIFITFSTTGLFIFSIVFVLINYKIFTKERTMLLPIILPVFYITIINLDKLTQGFNLTELQRVKIKNIVNLLSFNTSEVDSSGRNELLARLWYYVTESPFIGNSIGFGNSISGHNTIVGIWADAGVFALLVFFYLLFIYFKKSITATLPVKYIGLSFLITLSVYMLSLQTVINQPYLIAIFVYLGYLLDENQKAQYS